MELFARHLLAETLFYDEEYGTLGTLSLVDMEAGREQYIASFIPEEGIFLIEEATAWEEDYDPNDDELGYAMAVESEEHGRYELPEEAGEVLLMLANQHSLLPSLTLLFEEDEVL